VKSAGNAVIPTFPAHCPHGLQHLRHKRRNVRFERLRRVHTCLRQQDRTQRLTRRNRGRFGRGVVSLPSDRFARFGNPAWPGVRTANLAAFGAWSGVLPKSAESLRDSDALMRVAVPRRRGPAGLRDLFRFCRNCGLYILRSGLSACARQVWYHYPRRAPRVVETLGGRLSKQFICRFLRLGSLH